MVIQMKTSSMMSRDLEGWRSWSQ